MELCNKGLNGYHLQFNISEEFLKIIPFLKMTKNCFHSILYIAVSVLNEAIPFTLLLYFIVCLYMTKILLLYKYGTISQRYFPFKL